jgi:hypothetical protein
MALIHRSGKADCFDCILDRYCYYYSAGNAPVTHCNRINSQGWAEKLHILLAQA